MCVYAYTHVYTHIYTCVCVHMCACLCCGPEYIRIYGDQRSLLGSILSSHLPGFLRESLIISLSAAHWLADQWAPVSCLSLSLQHRDRNNTSLCLAFSHGFWGWNSGLLDSRLQCIIWKITHVSWWPCRDGKPRQWRRKAGFRTCLAHASHCQTPIISVLTFATSAPFPKGKQE